MHFGRIARESLGARRSFSDDKVSVYNTASNSDGAARARVYRVYIARARVSRGDWIARDPIAKNFVAPSPPSSPRDIPCLINIDSVL